jgi:ribosomal protein S18 acetylase RimI-like enzyme
LRFLCGDTTLPLRGQHATAHVAIMKSRPAVQETDRLLIRAAVTSDLPAVIALDEEVTSLAKRKYWKETFAGLGSRRRSPRFLLVAEQNGRIEGFIVGEIRAWEFGEPPCGWVFAIQVRPKTRLRGTATRLFEALCDAFRRAGVTKVRTIMARDNHLVLSFFRSQGMMAGPFIELETTLN